MEEIKNFIQTKNIAEQLINKPLEIRNNKDNLQNKLKGALKELFTCDNKYINNKIYVDGLDTNQIWGQISKSDQQLNNQIQKNLKNLLKTDDIELISQSNSENEEELEDEIAEEEDEINEDELYEDYKNESENTKNKKKDLFFNLDEMNRFIEEGDESDNDGLNLDENEDDDIDMLDNEEGIDAIQNYDEEDYKYDDLYGENVNKNDEINKDEDLEDGIFEQAREEGEMDNVKYINEEMKDQIKDIEDRMVDKKPWQLTGEVNAGQRPMNSLLEEHFDFNVASKMPLVITENDTNDLEKVIKQRILDEIFDDPIRKKQSEKKTNVDVNEFINFQKSQKGLGDIYEEEFNHSSNHARNPAEDSNKQEIDILFEELFNNLNVLSNFNYTPKFIDKDIKIDSKLPAFIIEEKLPFYMSEAGDKTANEMFNRRDAQFVDKNEMERNEKRRTRNKKKRAIHTHLKNKLINIKEKNRLETGVQMTKFEAKQIMKKEKLKKEGEKNNKRTKTTDFFSNMQNIVKNDIDKRKKQKIENVDNEIKRSSSKQYKL